MRSHPEAGTVVVMADITALIMDDHEWFRRQFALLDDASTPEQLTAIWQPLAQRLETHATARGDHLLPGFAAPR